MSEENKNQPAPVAAANPERKTLEQRNQMTELERIRHSCAHVMATAILRLWPDAQFAYGPPVENGFYYDLECSHRISPEDFEKIEAEMKKEEMKAEKAKKHEEMIADWEQHREWAEGEHGGYWKQWMEQHPEPPARPSQDVIPDWRRYEHRVVVGHPRPEIQPKERVGACG